MTDTPLPSWNDTPTRAAILSFVESVTAEVSPDLIAPPERVAVLDNDGTLWTEKPMPIQLDFLVRRFAEQAAADPSLQEKQPYKAAYTRDFGWLGEAMVKHYHGDDADMSLLQDAMNEAFAKASVEEYRAAADAFFETAEHPVLKRAVPDLPLPAHDRAAALSGGEWLHLLYRLRRRSRFHAGDWRRPL